MHLQPPSPSRPTSRSSIRLRPSSAMHFKSTTNSSTSPISSPSFNFSDRSNISNRTLGEPLLPLQQQQQQQQQHQQQQQQQQPSSIRQYASRRLYINSFLLILILTIVAVFTTPMLLRSFPRFLNPIATTAASRSGASIVAACANRQFPLQQALNSWLVLPHVAEIVLVDWSSDPPLQQIVQSVTAKSNSSIPVRVIRVENEPTWVLSRAYNLAFHHATADIVFKVDCDYIMHHDAIQAHTLSASQPAFYTGYYMNSRNANEMHLNGALVVSQARFWSIGGFDERIQTYGFDDDDLYHRLENSGASRLNVSFDSVSHISHNDKKRAQVGVKFPRVQIDINRLILTEISAPWNRSMRRSQYEKQNTNSNMLRAIYVPSALKTFVSFDEYQKIRKLSLGRRMNTDYGVPWGVISSLGTRASEIFLTNMNMRKKLLGYDEVVDQGMKPRFVLIHVQNGLGNRLRVLGSGIAFAKATGRQPIVIWEKDEHFGALYSDIFDDSDIKFPLIDKFQPQWPLRGLVKYDPVWGHIDFYNYMLPEDVGKFIVNAPKRSIYFKSSAIMNTNVTSWKLINEPIRILPIREDILKLASPIYNNGMEDVGGVHIRNRSIDEDIIGVKNNRDMYYKDDAALLDKWRATTKMSNFVGAMQGFLNNGTVKKYFVASDTIEVCRKLQKLFGEDRIVFLDRDCDDRGARCEKFAMADLLVLSKVKLLLGSTWSSFTGAAMRLGGPKALLAGTDFGKRPEVEL